MAISLQAEHKWRAVGIFYKLIQFAMGTGGQLGWLVGTLFRMGAVTNSVTGATTTVGLTLPGNTLVTTGNQIYMRVAGRCAANANAKTVRVLFGGVTINILNAVASNAKDFYADITVTRTGLNAQLIMVSGYANGALIDNLTVTATQTEKNALAFQVQVPATVGAADVVLQEVTIQGESG